MTTIQLPDDLAREIERLAGERTLSDYAADVLWREIRRNRQREALVLSGGCWRSKEHPELAEGGAAFVERIRSEVDERFQDALKDRN